MAESKILPEETGRYPHEMIHEFMAPGFRAGDVPEEDARPNERFGLGLEL